MILDSYKCLIANLPVNQHASTSKKETWKKKETGKNKVCPIPKHLAKIFGTNPTVIISRADLFTMAEATAIQQFVYGVILWGYSSGMRGKNYQNFVADIGRLEELIRGIRKNGNCISDWKDHWSKAKKIRGIGLSTYSKILYFMRTQVKGNRCLILDQVLIDVFADHKFDEFIEELGGITYRNAPDHYPTYLGLMKSESSRLDVTVDQLEMFLFMFGGKLKQEN